MRAHRARALSPDHPFIRGTAQNPDVYFQAREAVNPFYVACPDWCRERWTEFAALTGRAYHLFDYAGAPDAERVIVADGIGRRSGPRNGRTPARARRKGRPGEGAVVPPVFGRSFVRRCQRTVKAIAVLDRTKEPGSARRAALPGCRRGLAMEHATAARSRRCRVSSAGATACRPRNSRRPWSRRSMTN